MKALPVYVTLTGADDSVDPAHLVAISGRYPRVEWGILIGSRESARFPSKQWINALVEAIFFAPHGVSLSLHICGKYLRQISLGDSELMELLPLCAFKRAQLNWHGEKQDDIGEAILRSFLRLAPWDPEIIFQFDGVNDHLWHAASRKFACVGLFDQSHGAGDLPAVWPKPYDEICCGYAGGLGPDNVLEELGKIIDAGWRGQSRQPFWIDMETKLRSDANDSFDLQKCVAVLEQVCPSPFIA